VLVLAIVTHHPVAEQASTISGVPLSGIEAVVRANLAFHAVLMLVLVAQLVGLILFARKLILHRPVVIAGVIFCAVASVLMVIAMAFDGFVTAELVARCASRQAGCAETAADGLTFSSAIIQAFTKLGFGAQALGLAALSIAMWWFGGRSRIAAVFCTPLALAPVALLSSGAYVGPERLVQILAFYAVWGLAVAIVLGFGWLDPVPVRTASDAA
jgi:hypothetical protein